MASRDRRNINFEQIIDEGEHPAPKMYDDYGAMPMAGRREPRAEHTKGDRFTAQTVNGTAHAFGTGWNEKWNWESGQVKPSPTRPPGRSNRTGE